MVLLVQDKPEFKTWVGAGDIDAVLFTMRHRLIVVRMFVSVEHGPDLVVFLERILIPATALGDS